MSRRMTLAALMLSCTALPAQDVFQLYTAADLEVSAKTYTPQLRGLWEEDFLPRLTHHERSMMGTVILSLPTAGARRYPLEFYSDPPRRQVFLPIASVKFIDDLSIAFAYFDKHNCDQGTVTDYAAVLRFRPRDTKGWPLDVLGVPRTAFISDPYVDKLSQNLLKGIIFFVAAHEYAHVMYRHSSYASITALQAQQQEIEADAFALEVMRRIGVAPLALAHFFLVTSRLEASPGDFDSPLEYERYLQKRATHPVSALRIARLAQVIDQQTDAFTQLESDPVLWRKRLHELSAKLRWLSGTLDDRKTRLFLAQRAWTADVADFSNSCRP